MPRIAAVLGLLATAVFCVSFNVARYPAVWEMAAAPNALAPSDDVAQSVRPEPSSGPAQPARPEPTSSSPAEKTVPSAVAASIAGSVGSWQAGDPTAADPSYQAVEASPSGKYGASSGDAAASALPAEPEERASSGADSLVPISASPTSSAAAAPPGPPFGNAAPDGASGSGSDRVRRLPPVDQEPAADAAFSSGPLPEEPIPFYPTTPGP